MADVELVCLCCGIKESELGDGVKIKFCSKCQKMWAVQPDIKQRVGYCTRECQLKDWKKHKPICGKALEFGTVNKDTKLPQGFREQAQKEVDRSIKVMPAELDPLSHPQNMFLMTTLPNYYTDAVPWSESYPDGWTECFVTGKMKHLINSNPKFPAPIYRTRKPMYEIRDALETGGVGMFALETLSMGDVIVCERPLFVGPTAHDLGYAEGLTVDQMKLASLENAEAMMRIVFSRMHAEMKKKFMALANSHKDDGSGPLMGIVRTNGIHLPLKEPGRSKDDVRGSYTSVCDDLSRLNHSCNPNSDQEFDADSFSWKLFATKRIRKGEQITMTYCDTSMSYFKRQKFLLRYGFVCRCERCVAQAPKKA